MIKFKIVGAPPFISSSFGLIDNKLEAKISECNANIQLVHDMSAEEYVFAILTSRLTEVAVDKARNIVQNVLNNEIKKYLVGQEISYDLKLNLKHDLKIEDVNVHIESSGPLKAQTTENDYFKITGDINLS